MRIFLFLLSVSMASRANEQVTFHRIEQTPGPSQVQTVEPAKVESRRKAVYLSYEKFLRQRLEELNRQRPGKWQRDYSSVDAYLKSVSGMRARLK